jgi:hypothetical protein
MEKTKQPTTMDRSLNRCDSRRLRLLPQPTRRTYLMDGICATLFPSLSLSLVCDYFAL